MPNIKPDQFVRLPGWESLCAMTGSQQRQFLSDGYTWWKSMGLCSGQMLGNYRITYADWDYNVMQMNLLSHELSHTWKPLSTITHYCNMRNIDLNFCPKFILLVSNYKNLTRPNTFIIYYLAQCLTVAEHLDHENFKTCAKNCFSY